MRYFVTILFLCASFEAGEKGNISGLYVWVECTEVLYGKRNENNFYASIVSITTFCAEGWVRTSFVLTFSPQRAKHKMQRKRKIKYVRIRRTIVFTLYVYYVDERKNG